MMAGALNRNRTPKRSIMVRGTTFVSFVLLTGLVMVVGATGRAEDQAGPRSSGLMAVAAPRKLSKNSKASKDDTAISEEDVSSLLQSMVFEKAVDVYRFATQPAQSLASDEETATRADTNKSGGRELVVLDFPYEKYACTRCVNFFLWVEGLTPDEKEDFCIVVATYSVPLVSPAVWFYGLYMEYCEELVHCPFLPRSCCQVEGVCLKLLPS